MPTLIDKAMKSIYTLFAGLLLTSFGLFSQTPGTSAYDNLRSDTIDVLNYNIYLDFMNMGAETITGSCKVTFKSKMDNVNNISLDLLGFTIDSIQSNGQDLSYNYNDTLLTIQTPTILNTDDLDSVTIYYNGTPQKDPSGFGGFYFLGNYAFNLGVGFEANPHNYGRTWHPCFDNFVERASYTVTTKSPINIKTYGNGYIDYEAVGENNENIRRWVLEEEIPSYLACIGAAPYTHVDQVYTSVLNQQEIPIMLIAEPSDTTNMKTSFQNLIGAMEAFELRFGPYEWNKIAYALVPFNGGAMEHATCIMFPKVAANGSLTYEDIMAHELAHHWWGNLVTCRTSEDMWINEGLTAYSEAIFQEYVYGEEAYINHLKNVHLDVLKRAHYNDGDFYPISGVPHNATYGDHTYNKGATVTHNLRTYMGDDNFFAGLQAIQQNYAHKDINAEEFRDELNNETDSDVTDFFDDYLFQPGFNGFEIDSFTVAEHTDAYEVTVYIQQKIYEAEHLHSNVPLEITFVDENQNEHPLTAIVNGEHSVIHDIIPFAPTLVYLNKNYGLLNAVTGENYITEQAMNINADYAFFKLLITQESGNSFFRVEHYRVAPDPFIDEALEEEFIISPDRFWKIDGIFSDDFEAGGRFSYDSRNVPVGNLDNGLMKDHGALEFDPERIVLLWRSDQASDWQEFPSYTHQDLSNMIGARGHLNVDHIIKGEYTFGLRIKELSVDEEKLQNSIKVYPNPVKDVLKIKAKSPKDKYEIRVYNVNGELMYHGDMKSSNHQISTENFDNGTYHLMISNQGRLLKGVPFVK